MQLTKSSPTTLHQSLGTWYLTSAKIPEHFTRLLEALQLKSDGSEPLGQLPLQENARRELTC